MGFEAWFEPRTRGVIAGGGDLSDKADQGHMWTTAPTPGFFVAREMMRMVYMGCSRVPAVVFGMFALGM